MIILQPISTEQQIVIFARSHQQPGEPYNVLVVAESEAKNTLLECLGVWDGVRLTLDIEYPFAEGRWYIIKVYNPVTGNTLNYSKAYATAQADLEKYTVLDGYYKQIEKPDTDFIVKK